uniref:Uncharacterized protein n=1 Tax=Amphimedon queenslandica TaxID=400682 RepID=A0A1X7TCE1_AMPQE
MAQQQYQQQQYQQQQQQQQQSEAPIANSQQALAASQGMLAVLPFTQPYPLATPTGVFTIPPPPPQLNIKANEITNQSKRMFSEDSSSEWDGFCKIYYNDNVRDKASTNTTFEEIDQKYLQKAVEDGLVEYFVTKTV